MDSEQRIQQLETALAHARHALILWTDDPHGDLRTDAIQSADRVLDGAKPDNCEDQSEHNSPTITKRQREILRHALGLNRGRGSYRNHFVTGTGSKDYEDCMALVEARMMIECVGNEISGGDDVFLVTAAGRNEAARDDSEHFGTDHKPAPSRRTIAIALGKVLTGYQPDDELWSEHDQAAVDYALREVRDT